MNHIVIDLSWARHYHYKNPSFVLFRDEIKQQLFELPFKKPRLANKKWF